MIGKWFKFEGAHGYKNSTFVRLNLYETDSGKFAISADVGFGIDDEYSISPVSFVRNRPIYFETEQKRIEYIRNKFDMED